MNEDNSDSDDDLNEVAFIGNEDDEHGPGCLIAIAVTLSSGASIALLIVGIYAWSVGIFDGVAGAGAGPGFVIGVGVLFIAGIFGLFAGGAGIGMSLKSLQQCRRIGRGDLIGFSWLGFGLSVAAVLVSFGLGLAVMMTFWR